MSEVEIVNPVPVDEAPGWLANLVTTFLEDRYSDGFDKRVARRTRRWNPERTWGARDDDRWVATLATEPRTLTVPGSPTADLDVDALTAVTVAATHRRRGLLSRMMAAALERAKDAGDPLSILIAAEWPIYGRYGYAPATWFARYEYATRSNRAPLAPVGAGRVRQVEPDWLVDVAPGVFDSARRQRVGQVDRRGDWWRDHLELRGYGMGNRKSNVFVHEGADGVDGVLAWVPTGSFGLDTTVGTVDVLELTAATDEAYRNLWAYLSGIDLVGSIRFPSRPVDEPVRWLLGDARTLREDYRGDHTWLRLLDVPAALSARSYGCAGRLVLDVVDDDGGFATGRYLLDASADGVQCTRTSESPDLVLSQRALAAAYLGSSSLHQLHIGGGVDEHTPGAVARFDTMFAVPLAPWNATGF